MLTFGLADKENTIPVSTNTLFQIGSISKSFTSVCLLGYVERGIIQLDDPVSRILPWFQPRGKKNPIRLIDLLSHTAGIISGVDRSLSPYIEVAALNDCEVGSEPGVYFHYSNAGYKTLGCVIETIGGADVNKILQKEVLLPLGMLHASAAITNADREKLAVGYVPFFDDRPCPVGGKLAPAPWFENNSADGSIIADIEDMATYAIALLNEGQGLVHEESFKSMTEPIMPTSDGLHGQFYGLGLFIDWVNDHKLIGHSGGMVGYTSDLIIDVTSGVGVVALTNGDINATAITRTALAFLNDWHIPDSMESKAKALFTKCNGTYYCADEEGSTLNLRGEFLQVELNDVIAQVKPLSETGFLANTIDPFFPLYLHEISEDGYWIEWGERIFRQHPSTVHAEKNTRAFSEITGHYRSYNPWLSNFRVIQRGGEVIVVYPSGEEAVLERLTDLAFRVGKAPSPERIYFEKMFAGSAQSAFLGGQEYNRVFTP